MLLNDRLLTNQKVGLSNSFNLNSVFTFVSWTTKKKTEENNSVLVVPSRSVLDPSALILTLSLPIYDLQCRLNQTLSDKIAAQFKSE